MLTPEQLETARRLAAISLLCAGAFVIGRMTAPATPEVHEEEALAVHQTVWIRKIHDRDEQRTRVVIRDRWRAPDGTEREHEEEREASHVVERSESAGGGRTNVAERRELTVTPAQPDWRIGALVGAGVQVTPLAAALEVGAHVERRVAGPFFAGAWALARPGVGAAVGASVSLEF